MISTRQRWTSRVGFVLGVLLAGAVLMAGRVPAEGRPLDTHVKVSATATGGVSSLSERRIAEGRRLFPGGPALEGRVRLLNQTSGRASLLVRATAPDDALDELVVVELSGGGKPSLETTLGELRSWRSLGAPLASQRKRTISVRAWIPASVTGGHEGRRADVTLEFTREGVRR
jgi:hypothetical protein